VRTRDLLTANGKLPNMELMRLFFDAATLPHDTNGMQGLYASLELLPMWSGIESDVQLFASGRVLDDDGEWAGGQSLGEGSGSGSGVWQEAAVTAPSWQSWW